MDIKLKLLLHQTECLKAITSVFKDIHITSNNPIYQNPIIDLKDGKLIENIDRVWQGKDLDLKPIPKSMRKTVNSEILGIDAKLETGERVIIVTGCINALRSRVSGTLVNMIHALLRVIKYNYCKQCMRSKDVLALQY